MKHVTHEQKILVISAVWCLAACGAYAYAFVHLGTMRSMLHEERETVVARRVEMQSHARTKEVAQEVGMLREKLFEYITPGDLPTGFISEWETILLSLGITFDTAIAHRDDQDTSGTMRVLDVVLSVRGSEEMIRAGLRALEDLSYVSSVEGFSLNRVEVEEGDVWEGTIRIQAMTR